MSGCKKITTIQRQSSHSSLCRDPLIERRHARSSSEGVALGVHIRRNLAEINSNRENIGQRPKLGKMYHDDKENGNKEFTEQETKPRKIFHDDKENGSRECKGNEAKPRKMYHDDKENAGPNNGDKAVVKEILKEKTPVKDNVLKPSSLQLCIQKNEPDSKIGCKVREPIDAENTRNIWDYSDSEAAPASSWSALPNRCLLYRPLPLDVGKCTCVIVKETSPEGFDAGRLYTLYTNEGHGRQNRKLAVAYHRRRKGRSEFLVAQNAKGLMNSSEDGLIGIVTANLMGSKYHIWDQGHHQNLKHKSSKLLAAVRFMPTVSTWTGNYRSMKAWIPKHQSMQLKNTNQVRHINGLPTEWEDSKDKVHQLFSKIPHYNKISKQYELDFRDRGRAGLKIQSSVKNFQLTLERYGRQTILQLGRVGRSKYVMDYRYPLTGYQAFCMCLASIDSKLCCTV